MRRIVVDITDAMELKINDWLRNVIYPPVIERQKASPMPDQMRSLMESFWEKGYPYEGAIGGGLTYELSPTSIGMVLKVVAYGQTLDLTDYDSW
jgi:hypothetical protein